MHLCDQDGLAVEDPLTGGEAYAERSARGPGGALKVEAFGGGIEMDPGVAFEPPGCSTPPGRALSYSRSRTRRSSEESSAM